MTQMPRCNCMRGLQLHVLPASPFSALPAPPPPTPSHFTSQQHTKCYESYSPCLSPAHCHYTYFKAQYSMHLKIMSCSLFVCLCLYVYVCLCIYLYANFCICVCVISLYACVCSFISVCIFVLLYICVYA